MNYSGLIRIFRMFNDITGSHAGEMRGDTMKSKIKDIFIKYWMIPVSLLLLYPATIVCAVIFYLMGAFTGIEILIYIAHIVAGGLASLPITINIGNSEKLEKAAKVAIIVFIILLCALVSSSVLIDYLGNVIKAIIIVVIILFSSFWINKIRD